MKKIWESITVCAVILLTVWLSGCGEDADNGDAAPKIKVQLVTMDKSDQHWAKIDQGARKAAAELGNIDYRWDAPAAKDDAQQIKCIQNAVAWGARVILLAANGPEAVNPALKDATAAGVKIIFVDSAANYPAEAVFTTDNAAAGRTAGEQMLAALQARGITKGGIGIIGVNTATPSTSARENGFRGVFAGSEFTLWDTQYCEGDNARSQAAAEKYLSKGAVGLFSTNEGSTVGTGNAILAVGKPVVGIGFDESDAIKLLVKDGHLFCTIAQNPEMMGYQSVLTAAAVIAGKEPAQKYVDTGVSVKTKEAFK